MAIPKIKKKSKEELRINSFTYEPFNTDVPENKIIKIKSFNKYELFNAEGDKIFCYKITGEDNEEYLISYNFQNQLPYCDAIQYMRIKQPALFLGEFLIGNGESADVGYAWIPIMTKGLFSMLKGASNG